ncbi:carbohydrate-binding module family 18 [Annulohypoxylon maeteangense]|uniref:carbohydrate-binding module family 18 n=1 Tax=Annulohypoxylon maeteangense TaxID=1927788 RepID=UPI002007D3A1|nr:carbohydrate-binding module family 18 [Annulohypoxylon maeteangense]KAI0880374.1 carbohydrate-binding module family 18 [Annulohypoxylon maeteangense]
MRSSALKSLTLASQLTISFASTLPPWLSQRDVSPDLTCGNTGAGTKGYTCSDNLCCSQYGYCGNTTNYCSTGCQTQFGICSGSGGDGDGGAGDDGDGGVSPDLTCGTTGAGEHGYICPTGMCCSQYGYCGDSTDYCETGCQTAFGTCSGGSGGNNTGSDTDGRCGPDFDNAVCKETECCSASGYCGTTTDHCRAPDCLFDYGPACDANKTPTGINTSTLSRSPLGSVAVGGAGVYDCENEGDVALTFDDGPGEYTSELLDLLEKYNAKATFFITGINNGKGEIDNTSLVWPSVIRRMYSDGHQIASHTWSHADLSTVTSSRRKDEMVKNEMALRNILGFIPTYMRPPYSSCTELSGCQDDMASLEYHVVYFDLDTADYLNDSPGLIQNSKDNFDEYFEDKSSGTDDALVISHDIHEQTVHNLTEYMLQGIQSRGYKAVTVGECLGDPISNWYRQVA